MRKLVSGILFCMLLLSLSVGVQAAPLRVVVNHAPPYRIIDPPYYGLSLDHKSCSRDSANT